MIRVFLVEDEYIIREAIKRTVDWSAAGCELVGEAGDGEKAYQMILKAEPDILITDIRMPFMDGLDLSRLVRKKLPKTRIVILSGYDDFAYAKEAISIGVTEYLLKPVSGAKLMDTLRTVSKGIEADRQQTNYKEVYEAEHAERLKYEKQNLIRSVIDGKLAMADVIERGQTLGVSLAAAYYGIILMQLSVRDSERAGADQEPAAIADALAAILDMAEQKPDIGLYEQIGGVVVMLVMAPDPDTLKRRTGEELRTAAGIAGGSPDILFFASVGEPVERIREINQSYWEANRRFARRFLCDASRIFTGEDEEKENADTAVPERKRDEDAFSLSGFDIGKIDRRMLFHFLRSGTEQDVPAFVKDCFSGLSAANLNSQMVRQYIVMNTYLTTASFLQSAGLDNETIEKKLGRFTDPARIASVDGIAEYLSKIFTAALEARDAQSESRYGSIVAEAKQYIYRNFTQNDISLGTVAEAVGVSANHLSRLFSSSTGSTFIEFLTEVRMEKAKDMLLTTEAPGSEIALDVGYSDPHYFYYIFKKTQGMTPKEFRQERAKDGEPDQS